MRIVLMIIEWIPTIVIVDDCKSDERRSPPTAVMVERATRTPRPVTVSENPTTIVIWRPSPWFITDPGPTIRWTPNPMTVTIRRPVRIDVDERATRSPGPAIVAGVGPIAIGIEIFRAPNVFIVVLRLITQTLRKVFFAVFYPVVDPVAVIGNKVPVA
jgi:hypothetical protein